MIRNGAAIKYAIGYDKDGTAIETRSYDYYAYSNESKNYSIILNNGRAISNVEVYVGDKVTDVSLLSSGVMYNNDGTITVTAAAENGTQDMIELQHHIHMIKGIYALNNKEKHSLTLKAKATRNSSKQVFNEHTMIGEMF